VKFLVIGGSGFIGSHVMHELEHSGHEVIGTASRPGVHGLLKLDLLRDRLQDAIPRRFFDKESPVIVFAAVQGNMDQCFSHQEASRLVNVTKPIALIRDAVKLGGRVVFLSTGHVFDGATGNRREEEQVNPVNQYARQKFEVEQFLQKELPHALIARMDKVVGETLRYRHLLSEWWNLASNRQPIICVEGMEVSPTSVMDIARGLRCAAELRLSGTYHLAGPDRLTRAELARRFCASGDLDADVLEKPLEEFGFLDARAIKSSLNGEKFSSASGLRFSSADQILERFFKNIRRV